MTTRLRLCFIGDSITVGTGDDRFLGWPGRLAAHEHAAGHDVTLYNLGIRADTSEHLAARWEAEARARLPAHVDGALVFAFGVNDMAVERGKGLRVPVERSIAVAQSMLTAASAWLPTLWIGPAPVVEDGAALGPGPGITYEFMNERVAALNGAYAKLAERIGVPYLDIYSALQATPAWQPAVAGGDGVHPTAEGYLLMAEIIRQWPAWRSWWK
jgi:lysophospholipase L1-like esterase